MLTFLQPCLLIQHISSILNIEVYFMENIMFDYRSLGEELGIPIEIIHKFEQEANTEFPFDDMLTEIHILRAVKAYAKANKRMIPIEN